MSRHTVYKEDWIHLELEVLEDKRVFLHCVISDWSVSRAKQSKLIFNELVSCVSLKGIQSLYVLSDNKKLDKFCLFFGFNPIDTAEEFVMFVYEVK